MKFDPLNDNSSLVEYIQHMGNDSMVVNAARVSFNHDIVNAINVIDHEYQLGRDEKDRKLIYYLANNKHSSPFQHNSVTLHVSCPLFVYAQWRRHRTFNYTQINEVSRRYTSEGLQFYIPEIGKIRAQSDSNKQASDGMIAGEQEQEAAHYLISGVVDYCLEAYDQLLDYGVAHEMARMVLPQNMYTRFYCTMDLWNLYHYWTLRKDPHAQEEIRVYAEAIDQIATKLYPVSWEALKGA